ncbi:MAG: hypothetical protein K2Q25_08000 [Mycobacteriaceae bacterium]|nr:hypothetical protein [Mycobacteriaceae bacterium]
MQRIEDYGLLGLGSVTEAAVPHPPNAVPIVVVERQHAKPANLIAAAVRKTVPGNAERIGSRDADGRLWVSEAQASAGTLGEGRYAPGETVPVCTDSTSERQHASRRY